MSNQFFAFLLAMEGATLAVFLLLYFFIKRREPIALISVVANAMFGYFFWLLGGGIEDQRIAGIYVYRTALGLLCAQAALVLILGYYIIERLITGGGNDSDSE